MFPRPPRALHACRGPGGLRGQRVLSVSLYTSTGSAASVAYAAIAGGGGFETATLDGPGAFDAATVSGRDTIPPAWSGVCTDPLQDLAPQLYVTLLDPSQSAIDVGPVIVRFRLREDPVEEGGVALVLPVVFPRTDVVAGHGANLLALKAVLSGIQNHVADKVHLREREKRERR